jgi:thiol-disulfide isomerase/thioredoxin
MSLFDKKVAYLELPDFDERSKRFTITPAPKKPERYAIMCMATWCGACVQTKPEYASIADELMAKNVRATCILFDGDDQEQLLAKKVGDAHKVNAFPTFLMIDEEGNVKNKLVGGMRSKDLKKAILESF